MQEKSLLIIQAGFVHISVGWEPTYTIVSEDFA